MFKLHVFQAEQGDCLLLEFGPRRSPRYILVDGGPSDVYEPHLRPFLQRLSEAGRTLERVVLSHIDGDHVGGLLEFLLDLQVQRRLQPESRTLGVEGLWHNSFEESTGLPHEVRAALSDSASGERSLLGASPEEMVVIRSVPQGNWLRELAEALGIPANADFGGGSILLDDARPLRFGGLRLRVVGPTRANLDELRDHWLEWYADQVQRVEAGVRGSPDTSVPNLSSIVLLARAHGRSVLLTGDARDDHILQGLAQAGLLDRDGRLHVSILKAPHHASDRNHTPAFLNAVTADTYVISANGMHGNPDPAVLRWIVEAAHADGRPITLVLTNETESVRSLVQTHDPARYGYTLRILPAGESFLTLTLDLV